MGLPGQHWHVDHEHNVIPSRVTSSGRVWLREQVAGPSKAGTWPNGAMKTQRSYKMVYSN